MAKILYLSDIRKVLQITSGKTYKGHGLKDSAVMLLLSAEKDNLKVILTRRSMHVGHHKGEICFPGGKKEQGDDTLLDTALRETQEEIGVVTKDIEVLGHIDEVTTTTGFLIRPYVGIIQSHRNFLISAEVDSILEMPIECLFSDDNRRDEVRLSKEYALKSTNYVFDGNVVFGATARMLDHFSKLIGSVR